MAAPIAAFTGDHRPAAALACTIGWSAAEDGAGRLFCLAMQSRSFLSWKDRRRKIAARRHCMPARRRQIARSGRPRAGPLTAGQGSSSAAGVRILAIP
jgi:hypothetical protein